MLNSRAAFRKPCRWCEQIGFPSFARAKLSYSGSEIRFSLVGRQSSASRRESDLYILADDLDTLYQQLNSSVVVLEDPHETFHGMRESIIRDLNGFWITFGQAG